MERNDEEFKGESKLKEPQAEINRLQEKLNRLKKEVWCTQEQSNQQISKLQKENAEMESRYIQHQKEFTESKQKWSKEIKKMNESNAMQKSMAESTEARNADLTKEYDEQIAKMIAELESTKKDSYEQGFDAVKQLTLLNAKAKQRRMELQEKDKEIRMLMEKVANSEDVMNEKTKALEEVQIAIRESKKKKQEILATTSSDITSSKHDLQINFESQIGVLEEEKRRLEIQLDQKIQENAHHLNIANVENARLEERQRLLKERLKKKEQQCGKFEEQVFSHVRSNTDSPEDLDIKDIITLDENPEFQQQIGQIDLTQEKETAILKKMKELEQTFVHENPDLYCKMNSGFESVSIYI